MNSGSSLIRLKKIEWKNMFYRRLGNSLMIPSVLGLGALHFGVYCDQAETTRIIHEAIDLGINFIDTATMYGQGHSQSLIKNAIKGRRSKVLIGTKVGLKPKFGSDGAFGVEVTPLTRKLIRLSIDNDLKELGTDYIDLYQVHAFDNHTPVLETMQTLNELLEEGKVRHIGCSNYIPKEIEITSDIASENGLANFVSLQNHYNMIERRLEEALIPICDKHNIGIICYRALVRGVLTGKYKRGQPLPNESRASSSYRVKRLLSEDNLSLIEKLDQFSKTRGFSLAQLAIAWLLKKENVSVVLVGVRNLDQLRTNVQATQWKLTKEDEAEIDILIENMGLMSQVKAMPETFLET